MASHKGVTLIEVLVVLAVLSVMAGVVSVAWRPGRWTTPDPDSTGTARALREARLRAVDSGAAVTVILIVENRRVPVTAFPDGAIVGADALGVDPLSGVAQAVPARR